MSANKSSPPPAAAAAMPQIAVQNPTPLGAAQSVPPPSSKPRPDNPVLKMMGIRLPKRLPSRNWSIFLALTGSLTGAIIYDRREKDRATKRWSKAVSHLSSEVLPRGPSQMPRRLTVYLSAAPGDGLYTAQLHYREYVKPVLVAAGVDWDFVQGRAEGDVRAAVAERVRRHRCRIAGESVEPLRDAERIEDLRAAFGIPAWEGVQGAVVVGRHTWKEYVRGLHEGWLGPVHHPRYEELAAIDEARRRQKEAESEKPGLFKKNDDRPRQPPPYNSPEDYPHEELAAHVPRELEPAAIVPFPQILGFLRTPIRVWRYLHRRELADEIGREVAAAVFASYREFGSGTDGQRYEQQSILETEEQCWPKSTWRVEEAKPDKPAETPAETPAQPETIENIDAFVNAEAKDANQETDILAQFPKERIWTKPVVLDARIASRMRRFEIQNADVERARNIQVREEEIEGWMKGSLRSIWRWAKSKVMDDKQSEVWVYKE